MMLEYYLTPSSISLLFFSQLIQRTCYLPLSNLNQELIVNSATLFPFAGSRPGGRLPLSTATKEAKCRDRLTLRFTLLRSGVAELVRHTAAGLRTDATLFRPAECSFANGGRQLSSLATK